MAPSLWATGCRTAPSLHRVCLDPSRRRAPSPPHPSTVARHAMPRHAHPRPFIAGWQASKHRQRTHPTALGRTRRQKKKWRGGHGAGANPGSRLGGQATGPARDGGGASGNGIGDTKRAKLRLTRPLPLGTWDGTAAMPQCPMPCHATAGTKSRGLPACLPACLSRTRRTQPTSVSTTQMTLLVDDGQCLVSGSQRGWVDFGEREEGAKPGTTALVCPLRA